MLKKIRKKMGALCWVVLVLFTVSCSSSGSGSSSSTTTSTTTDNTITDTTTTEDTSSTTLTLSGSVDISSSDVSNLQSSSTEARNANFALRAISSVASENTTVTDLIDSAVSGAVARLYEINSDGELAYTGHQTTVNTNGVYSFDSIAVSTNISEYVVKVKKQGVDAQGNYHMLECESYVPVPISEGPVVLEANVSDVTTAISSYIRNKIASSEIEFTAEQVDFFISIVTDLIDSGTIQAPDIVQNSSADEDLFTDDDGTLDDSDATAQIINTLDTNDTIVDINEENLIKSKLAKNVEDMSREEAVSFIRNVFGVASSSNDSDDRGGTSKGDSGPGDFFINGFADAFLAGKTASIDDLSSALVDSGVPISESTLSNLISNSVAEFLTELYTYYDGGDQPEVSNLPIVKAVFPDSNRITLVNDKVPTDLQMPVPQMIEIFGIAGLFDDSFQFDPLVFTQKIGFITIEDGNIYIMHSNSTSTSVWVSTGVQDANGGDIWAETDALFAEVEIFGTDANGNPISSDDISRVTVSYPKEDGSRGEAILTSFNWDDMGHQDNNPDDSSNSDTSAPMARVNAKRSSSQLKKYNAKIASAISEAPTDGGQQGQDMMNTIRYELNPWGNNGEQPTLDDLVTDFVTGELIFNVYLNDGDLTADTSSTMQIIHVSLGDVQWVFPTGPDMERIKNFGWDDSFDPTRIPLPEGDTTVEGGIVKWEAPSDETLAQIPTSCELVYAIDIGLTARPVSYSSDGMDLSDDIAWDWSDDWFAYKHLWDSWQRGTFIRGTQFKLPITLSETLSSDTYVTEYEINIRCLLQDKKSKMILSEGRSSRTTFQVGEATSWESTLSGTVYFPSQFIQNEGQDENNGEWKIGLFKMDGMAMNDSGQMEWTDFFYALGNSTARMPLSNSDNELLVASLGTSSELATNGTASFELPTITSEDDLFERNTNYRFIVWYDYSEKPTWADWSQVTLAQDGIEFSHAPIFTYPLEKHFQDGNIRFDNGALIYESWNGNKSSITVLSDSTPDTLALTPFNWIGDTSTMPVDNTDTTMNGNTNNGNTDNTTGDHTQNDTNTTNPDDDFSLDDLVGSDISTSIDNDGTIHFEDMEGNSATIDADGVITLTNAANQSFTPNMTLNVSFANGEVTISDDNGNMLTITGDGTVTYSPAGEDHSSDSSDFSLAMLAEEGVTFQVQTDGSIVFTGPDGGTATISSTGTMMLSDSTGSMDSGLSLTVVSDTSGVITITDGDGNQIVVNTASQSISFVSTDTQSVRLIDENGIHLSALVQDGVSIEPFPNGVMFTYDEDGSTVFFTFDYITFAYDGSTAASTMLLSEYGLTFDMEPNEYIIEDSAGNEVVVDMVTRVAQYTAAEDTVSDDTTTTTQDDSFNLEDLTDSNITFTRSTDGSMTFMNSMGYSATVIPSETSGQLTLSGPDGVSSVLSTITVTNVDGNVVLEDEDGNRLVINPTSGDRTFISADEVSSNDTTDTSTEINLAELAQDGIEIQIFDEEIMFVYLDSGDNITFTESTVRFADIHGDNQVYEDLSTHGLTVTREGDECIIEDSEGNMITVTLSTRTAQYTAVEDITPDTSSETSVTDATEVNFLQLLAEQQTQVLVDHIDNTVYFNTGDDINTAISSEGIIRFANQLTGTAETAGFSLQIVYDETSITLTDGDGNQLVISIDGTVIYTPADQVLGGGNLNPQPETTESEGISLTSDNGVNSF